MHYVFAYVTDRTIIGTYAGGIRGCYKGSLDTRKSLTGYVFTIYGGAVNWKANLQLVVALSTTKAKYIVVIEVIKEAIWLKGIIKELGIEQDQIVVFCDNQSAIAWQSIKSKKGLNT